MAEELTQLLHRGDLDGLVRLADGLALAGRWDDLLVLRDGCLEAAELTGKQLWGAAQYAEYRIALDAPGPLAAGVIRPGAGRFALGPLTEVVAAHHAWKDLVDHLEDPVSAAVVAQERVVRGEDLTGDPRAEGDELELPLVIQPWEPAYPLPTYRPDELLENGPTPVPIDERADVQPGPLRTAPDIERAVLDLAEHWATESSGQAAVAVVDGPAAAAVAALAANGVRLGRITLGQAFARMAWTAASGGAHGRRRGLAAGRSAAWWAGHVLAGLPFPADPDELEYELEGLDWWTFTQGDEPGWSLRLAVEHPDGWAVAVSAHDRRETPTNAD